MNPSAWSPTVLSRQPRLRKSQRVDVVVIGGGITGLSAAYQLHQAGVSVCVLERDRLGSGDTLHTTAHLTWVTDLRLRELTRTFGDEQARLVCAAGAAAIDTIEAACRQEEIACDFRRVPGFLHASLTGDKDESRRLKAEAEIANRLGFAAAYVAKTPLVDKPGVRVPNQAKFHPLKYLAGLTTCLTRAGVPLFEKSEVTEVEDDPLAVRVGDTRISCSYVIVATHVPIIGKTPLVNATLLQTKLYPYSSYALRATIAKNSLPEMCLWDTSDPYYYLRVDRGERQDSVIFGGEDHKTGQADDAAARFVKLEERLHAILPQAKVDRRWSGQVVETNDGLPFIGETTENQFVATGFSGNGMTFGTLAGIMARDAVLKRDNPWQQLFRVNRKKLRGGTLDYVKENVDFPYYFARDRLTRHPTTTRGVKRGDGQVLKLAGQPVACSRDDDGKLTTVSAVCTHMGCLVRWNDAERTWDCPCHGSRFDPQGAVIAGPAETPLEAVSTGDGKKTSPHARAPASKGRT